MEGNETLVRAYGIREIGSGLLSLSVDKDKGLWSRVAGDALDVATLSSALNAGNPRRDNAKLALAMVAGVMVLDVIGALAVTTRHRRGSVDPRRYSDRSGFPRGVEQARGLARDAARPAAHDPAMAGATRTTVAAEA